MPPVFFSDGGALMARLDEARAYWRGDKVCNAQRRGSGDGSPPAGQLLAAYYIALGVLEALQEIDANDALGYQEPVGALYRALYDLIEGNNPPDWIKPRKIQDKSVDGIHLWEARLCAAVNLQTLIRLGIARARAQRMIFKVVQRHGIPAKSDAAVYRWLRSCRETSGKAPESIKAAFKEMGMVDIPDGGDPESDADCLTRLLATELQARGYLPRR